MDVKVFLDVVKNAVLLQIPYLSLILCYNSIYCGNYVQVN